jgi:trehalose 6-phosphate phosphatase
MASDADDLFGQGLDAVIFDLDGVITRTATIHAKAWKRLFDTYLARREGRDTPSQPFRVPEDYTEYVDGKPRYDGVRSFLLSRDIDLPWGTAEDAPYTATVCGLGNAKNIYFNEVIDEEGVEVFTSAVALIEALRACGIRTACVSSSKNCRPVLERTGLLDHFDVVFDGLDLQREELPGKPEPDAFLRSAELLGTTPQRAALVEDAVSGVQAGRAGAFKLVIGIDGGAGRDALLANGADVVVDDLAAFLPEDSERSSPTAT